jgi:hypothetical protein
MQALSQLSYGPAQKRQRKVRTAFGNVKCLRANGSSIRTGPVVQILIFPDLIFIFQVR